MTELFGERTIANWAAKGAVYEGLFHPADSDKDFWKERAINAAAGLISFGAFRASTGRFLKSETISRLLLQDDATAKIFAGTAVDTGAGAIAGVTDSLSRSTFHGKMPDFDEIPTAALQFGALGGAMHLGHAIFSRGEPYAPKLRMPSGALDRLLRGADEEPLKRQVFGEGKLPGKFFSTNDVLSSGISSQKPGGINSDSAWMSNGKVFIPDDLLKAMNNLPPNLSSLFSGAKD
ncbi:MAG: hypothetical protein ACRD3W_30850, partial [Terriglobales bacterium]